MLAWVAQGSISERTEEHLGSSDRGFIMYHKMLVDQMERVERGERPTLGVVEDPDEKNPTSNCGANASVSRVSN